MSEKEPISYKDAGVDIDAATNAISRAKALIERTHNRNCLSGVGSFGGLYRVPTEEFTEPVLVSSTDSVGTKVKVAILADRHDTLGGDIVNHCVNDILVQGAKPLFFLDYVGIGNVAADTLGHLLGGLAAACAENDCALIGGETAEMPDLYAEGEYDLVGTIVGVVDRNRILDGTRVTVGDRLIGLPSSGLHTNGYTLARKVLFERQGYTADQVLPELGESVGDALLAVHRSYLKVVWPLLEDDLIHAMAHITGGGLVDNLPRVLPEGVAAVIQKGAWTVPPIFKVLREQGPVAEEECYRAFNMGVGMVLIVAAEKAEEVLARAGEGAVEIGEIVAGDRTVTLSS
jgi:phosphoribosylformylglycinamidine cyclo-ligase